MSKPLAMFRPVLCVGNLPNRLLELTWGGLRHEFGRGLGRFQEMDSQTWFSLKNTISCPPSGVWSVGRNTHEWVHPRLSQAIGCWLLSMICAVKFVEMDWSVRKNFVSCAEPTTVGTWDIANQLHIGTHDSHVHGIKKLWYSLLQIVPPT